MVSSNGAVLCALTFCNLTCVLQALIGTTQSSHWCPAIELRRVTCLRNVSVNGQPPVMRRVYQWKKEMVMRCCPGFMGPTCEKACFSCQQWAEATGRIHHLEQYLSMITHTQWSLELNSSQEIMGCVRERVVDNNISGNPLSRSTKPFQAFSLDQSTGQVCWTKDGRPVHGGEITPGSRSGVKGRGGSRVGSGEISETSGRNRLGYYTDSAPYYYNRNGCPIYSNRRSSISSSNSGGDGESRSSPYSSSHYQRQQQRRQQLEQQQLRRRGQYEERARVAVDARRVLRDEERRDFKSRSRSLYQRHPPASDNQDTYGEFKAAEMVVSLEELLTSTSTPSSLPRTPPSLPRTPSSLPRTPPSLSKTEEFQPGLTDEGRAADDHDDDDDDDTADVTNRTEQESESALQIRLTILERHILELETKLSALSSALTSVSSLKDQIGQLTDKLAKLQGHLEIPETRSGPRRDDLSSGQSENEDRREATRRRRRRHKRRRGKHRFRIETSKDLNRKPNSNAVADNTNLTTSTGDETGRRRRYSPHYEKQTETGSNGEEKRLGGLENRRGGVEENGDRRVADLKENKDIGHSEHSREVSGEVSGNERRGMAVKEDKPFGVAERSGGESHRPLNSSSSEAQIQNGTSARCDPSCARRRSFPPSPPPLPDKDVVEAVFSTSASSVVDAWVKGHGEFYQELKKALHHKERGTDSNISKDRDGSSSRSRSLADGAVDEEDGARGASLIPSGENKQIRTTATHTKGIQLPLGDGHENKHYDRADFLVSWNNWATSATYPRLALYNIITLFVCTSITFAITLTV